MEYLTTSDVSKILDVEKKAVRDWVRDKRLQSYKVASHYRIAPDALIEYLEKLKNPPQAMDDFRERINSFIKEKNQTLETANQMNVKTVSIVEDRIRALLFGLVSLTPDHRPQVYTAQLRNDMDFLQTLVSETDYIRYMAKIFGCDEREVLKRIAEIKSAKILEQ
jgi:excisionase family DNA binding protein